MSARTLRTAGLVLALAVVGACATNQGVAFRARTPAAGSSSSPTLQGLLVKPEGPGPFPAVVLLHTCGGVRSHVSADWPSFLVGQGYVALTVDSFGARGLGPCPNSLIGPSAAGSFQGRMNVLGRDALGGLDYLAGLPFVKASEVAVIGYSLGGMTIHHSLLGERLAVSGRNAFRAAISLYGPCAVSNGRIPMPALTSAPIPLLEILGEKDAQTTRHCQELLPKDGSVTIHVLPGIYHAFDQSEIRTIRNDSGGNPMLYDAGATAEARKLVAAFLARHLKR